ncbi:MAG: HEAT repeat domain-containing protein [Methanosarcinaceae archaeon]|nr:HEAT repeat domain-containing protein [Methanosarcinaceae archaeon]
MGLDKPDVNKMESERDIEGLVEALGYKNDIVIFLEAMEALKKFGNEAVESLIKGLESKEVTIKLGAAELLGKIADLRAVEPLIVLIAKDRNEVVIATGIKSLGQIGDLRAVKPLEIILQYVNPTGEKYDVHQEATIALQKIKGNSSKQI